MRAHLREMKMAERAIARAVRLYAEQGHDDLCNEAAQLQSHAQIAVEVIEKVIEAQESQGSDVA